MTRWAATVGVIAIATVGSVASAVGSRPQTPPRIEGGIEDSLAGAASFDQYCATCHGRSGRGDGPLASSLKTAPADLTVLARRNNGVFPAQRVAAAIVDSTRTAAHGTLDMPVWGPRFRDLDSVDEREGVRLRNLLAFLASIQLATGSVTGSPGPDPNGADLYRDYCASCHGSGARGNGPFTFALKTPAPNLRTLAARNGGTFPRERVVAVIQGAGLEGHGARDMPVWGDVFRRLRPRDPGAGARIEALVSFLEGIQDGRQGAR